MHKTCDFTTGPACRLQDCYRLYPAHVGIPSDKFHGLFGIIPIRKEKKKYNIELYHCVPEYSSHILVSVKTESHTQDLTRVMLAGISRRPAFGVMYTSILFLLHIPPGPGSTRHSRIRYDLWLCSLVWQCQANWHQGQWKDS